jgi:hypothetical protein
MMNVNSDDDLLVGKYVEAQFLKSKDQIGEDDFVLINEGNCS